MIRASAKYSFGLAFSRFIPLNDDLSIPFSTTVDPYGKNAIIGGAGPFDFSGVAAIAAVDIVIQIDNEDPVTSTIDLSGAVSQSAVTVAELVSALDVMFGLESLSLDASAEAVTGRLKIVSTDTADPPDYIQIYDEAAEIAMIGQGFGMKFVKTDTLKSIGDTPILKDEETFTTTDANALDTEVITDGYRKGATIEIIDSAEDWELLALIESGTYDDSVSGAEEYESPTSEDIKVYFYIESFYEVYQKGTNKKADLVGYVKLSYRSCKGQVGAGTHELGFADGNYTVTCTSYRDPDNTDNVYGDTWRRNLTKVAYDALDVYNV